MSQRVSRRRDDCAKVMLNVIVMPNRCNTVVVSSAGRLQSALWIGTEAKNDISIISIMVTHREDGADLGTERRTCVGGKLVTFPPVLRADSFTRDHGEHMAAYQRLYFFTLRGLVAWRSLRAPAFVVWHLLLLPARF